MADVEGEDDDIQAPQSPSPLETGFAAALDRPFVLDHPAEAPGFASALDNPTAVRCYCSRFPCFANREKTIFTLVCVAIFCSVVAFYFTAPWVPVLEQILDWVDERGTWGIVLLFGLHQVSLLSIFGPAATLEYGWVFLRGWQAAPVILLSYSVAIAIMLFFGNTFLRPCIVRRVRDSRLMQATQRVLDANPYIWYFLFQFWSIVPWRASVYCAHVLAPHSYLVGIGLAVLIGQLPDMMYRIFLATKITNLDSLVTGRLDTPLDTGIFWGSIVVTTLISILLYVKIRKAFMEAAGRDRRENEEELRSGAEP